MESEVFDKAKYHYGADDFPKELPETQSFVPTGLFIGWLVERKHYSESFAEDAGDLIAQFRQRAMTGPEIYEHFDGVFADDMLDEQGLAFFR